MANPFSQYADPTSATPAAVTSEGANPFAQYGPDVIGMAAALSPTGASDTSGFGALNVAGGIKSGLTDAWLASRQVLASIWKTLPGMAGNPDAMKQAQDWQDELQLEAQQKRAAEAPLMATPGGVAGSAFTQGAMAAPLMFATGGAGFWPLVGRAAGAGFLQQFFGRPTTPDDTSVLGTSPEAVRAGNAFSGATTAAGLQTGFGALGAILTGAKPIPGAGGIPASSRQAAVDYLGPGATTYGQQTGSPFWSRVQQFIAATPGGFEVRNVGARANAKLEGDANALTMNQGGGADLQNTEQGRTFFADDGFNQALTQRIPAMFRMMPPQSRPAALDEIAAWAGGKIPNPALANLSDVPVKTASGQLISPRQQYINSGVPAMIDPPGGASGLATDGHMPMTSDPNGPRDFNNYQAIRSWAGRRAYDAKMGTPDQVAWTAFRDELDQAAIRSLQAQGADPTALQTARNAYQLQKAFEPAEIPQPDGSWTYDRNKLGAAINKGLVGGDFNNLPRDTQVQLQQMGNAISSIKPLPTSGTAENQMARGVATGELLTHDIADAPAALGRAALSLGAAPFLINRGIQAFSGGVPGLRSIPPAAARSLSSIFTGAGTSAFAPDVTPENVWHKALGYYNPAQQQQPEPQQ